MGKRIRSSVTVGILTDAAKSVSPHLTCPAKLSSHTLIHSCNVLIVSRAEQSFLDEGLAQKLNIPLVPLAEPLHVGRYTGRS